MVNNNMTHSIMSCFWHTFQAYNSPGPPPDSIGLHPEHRSIFRLPAASIIPQYSAMLSHLQKHIYITSKNIMSQGIWIAKWLLVAMQQFPLIFHTMVSDTSYSALYILHAEHCRIHAYICNTCIFPHAEHTASNTHFTQLLLLMVQHH